jgi:CDP-diglyceride synthetase
MAKGILGLLGLAGTLVVALPIAVLGLDFLLGSRPAVGAALLAVAALVVALGDLPEKALGRTAERLEPDDEE